MHGIESVKTASAAAPLAGRVALVTGASSGIGRATALALARAGADVAITYRENVEGARSLERELSALGRRTVVFTLDLRDGQAIDSVGPAVRDALGRVDIWVNNAGADILTGAGGALSDLAKLDTLLAVDLRGTILMSWSAVELMRRQESGGVIVNVSWDHVNFGFAGRSPEMYSAVKGGILSFSKSLARTVAPHVRVNIVSPGFIETAVGEHAQRRIYDEVVAKTPMKRWGQPEDVAAAVVYLTSPAASFLTGQTIMVGGGVMM
jgi:3-oxoacyl-[acyl-carrier protein] reductase